MKLVWKLYRPIFGLLVLSLFCCLAKPARAQESIKQTETPCETYLGPEQRSRYNLSPDYHSPYSVSFSFPLEKLLAPDTIPPRNSPRMESKTPHEDWYSSRIQHKYGAWGPEPLRFPPPYEGFEFSNADPQWMRERLVAVALKYVGLPYQHHHIPDWDPPSRWPWKEVAYGRNSRGVDCSDFTSWVYNYGLGIKITSDVHKQAEAESASAPGRDGRLPIEVISNKYGYEDLVKRLRTGDLLYIKKKSADKVSHVIMWVGSIGRSPDGTPLVIDSTGSNHKDSNGVTIPVGIHLRPFTKDSWYFQSLSHAHRIIP